MFARIQAAAERIKRQSQVLVVVGIGGSYLGARALIELLSSPNYNLKVKDTPDIYFTGNGLSTDALLELIALIGDRDFSVNVISKSGTTTEPAVAFRIFKGMLEQKYGKEGARERIYATTDRARGALKGLADQEGYETFVVPDAVGGRYSVLTAVGLLPIAAAGIDIAALMEGAARAMKELSIPGMDNPAWQYAAARNFFNQTNRPRIVGRHTDYARAAERMPPQRFRFFRRNRRSGRAFRKTRRSAPGKPPFLPRSSRQSTAIPAKRPRQSAGKNPRWKGRYPPRFLPRLSQRKGRALPGIPQ